MIDFKNIIHSKLGKYIISIILGLGLASLFRRACHDRKCYKFVGPNIKEIDEKIYKFNKKCYSFKPEIRSRDPSKKHVEFE
jgi:hypothetical protein